MTRETYTHGHHPSVLASHTWRTVENSAAYLIPHLAPGLDVLDVGSGPGTITVDLAERVAPGTVLGIDAAPGIIEQAQSLAADRGVGNARFAVGDAYALELPDASVDIAHAHQVLQHVARPVDALREMRRVVRPGGVVAARDVDYSGTMWFPLLPGLAEWLDLYLRVHRGNGGEPDAGRRLKSWAREAGFGSVTATASIWCFSSDEERAWWGGSWAERATESRFAADAVDNGYATRGDLERIAAAWTEWAEHPDGWFAMPHGEIIARD